MLLAKRKAGKLDVIKVSVPQTDPQGVCAEAAV